MPIRRKQKRARRKKTSDVRQILRRYRCEVEEVERGTFRVTNLNASATAAVDAYTRDLKGSTQDNRAWAMELALWTQIKRRNEKQKGREPEHVVRAEPLAKTSHGWQIRIIDDETLLRWSITGDTAEAHTAFVRHMVTCCFLLLDLWAGRRTID